MSNKINFEDNPFQSMGRLDLEDDGITTPSSPFLLSLGRRLQEDSALERFDLSSSETDALPLPPPKFEITMGEACAGTGAAVFKTLATQRDVQRAENKILGVKVTKDQLVISVKRGQMAGIGHAVLKSGFTLLTYPFYNRALHGVIPDDDMRAATAGMLSGGSEALLTPVSNARFWISRYPVLAPDLTGYFQRVRNHQTPVKYAYNGWYLLALRTTSMTALMFAANQMLQDQLRTPTSLFNTQLLRFFKLPGQHEAAPKEQTHAQSSLAHLKESAENVIVWNTSATLAHGVSYPAHALYTEVKGRQASIEHNAFLSEASRSDLPLSESTATSVKKCLTPEIFKYKGYSRSLIILNKSFAITALTIEAYRATMRQLSDKP